MGVRSLWWVTWLVSTMFRQVHACGMGALKMWWMIGDVDVDDNRQGWSQVDCSYRIAAALRNKVGIQVTSRCF